MTIVITVAGIGVLLAIVLIGWSLLAIAAASDREMDRRFADYVRSLDQQ